MASIIPAPVTAQNSMIQYGETRSASMSGQSKDLYVFHGNAGDTVFIRMTMATALHSSSVTLLDQTGNELITGSGSAAVNVNKKLPYDADYTIRVSGMDPGTGYNILLQRVNMPMNPRNLLPGKAVYGWIKEPGQADFYTFFGKAGDQLEIRMDRKGSEISPRVLLFSPGGIELTDKTTHIASDQQFQGTFPLPEDGTYTLVAMEAGKGDGEYDLQVRSTYGGGMASVIPLPAVSGTEAGPSATASPGNIGGLLDAGGLGLLVIIALAILVLASGIVLKMTGRVGAGKPAAKADWEPQGHIKPDISRTLPPGTAAGDVKPGSATHDVFISYSGGDKLIADAVCGMLEARKIRCWIAPRDIMPGTSYANGILTGIENCKVFVLIFSAGSNKSPHVMREVERAVSMGLPIITFRIEDIKPSHEMIYYLGPIHWMDAMTPPVEAHIGKLAETIEYLLRKGRE